MAPCKRVGCAVFGSDATNGYCSKCHKARVQTTATTTTTTPEATNSSDQTVAGETIAPTVAAGVPQRNAAAEPTEEHRGDEEESTSAREQSDRSTFQEEQGTINAATMVEIAEGHRASQKGVDGALRCYSCTKRLSFAWPCKCGQVFCSSHGHYTEHSCPFDYKASGRAAIAKANPIVTGSKVKKI